MQEVLDEKILRMAIAANVIRLRSERDWSQVELAKKLGVSVVHLSRIENGHASPSSSLIFTLADVFGVSTDALRQVSEKISAA